MNYARAYFFFRYRSHFWLAARRCDCFEPLHFMYWGFVIASAFLTSLAASPRAMPNLVRQSMNSPKRRARSGAIFSMRFLGPKRAILFLEITYTHTNKSTPSDTLVEEIDFFQAWFTRRMRYSMRTCNGRSYIYNFNTLLCWSWKCSEFIIRTCLASVLYSIFRFIETRAKIVYLRFCLKFGYESGDAWSSLTGLLGEFSSKKVGIIFDALWNIMEE